jgi:hypothetical protein
LQPVRHITSAIPLTATAWQYGYGTFDEKTQRVTGFTKLPHFTGSAWQGGSAWPDGKLGWAQLTAAGGHPGNDLAHAAIRRWTAPSDMRVSVRSTLIHEPKEGQGVRGFLVSSKGGLLKQVAVHHGQADLNADSLDLQTGDTLDFVADIGSKLSYNQFLWRVTVTADEPSALMFDSLRDFGDQSLASWAVEWTEDRHVIFGARDGTIVVADGENGHALQILRGHTGFVRAIDTKKQTLISASGASETSRKSSAGSVTERAAPSEGSPRGRRAQPA